MATATAPAALNVSVCLPKMTHADVQRLDDIKTRWNAYRGTLMPPFTKAENEPDFNVLDNRCAPIVDKGASWLFKEQLKLTVSLSDGPDDDADDTVAGPGDVEGTNDAQDWLSDALGDMDDLMTLLSMAAVNGGVCGQTFLKLDPADPQAGREYPKITVLDPAHVWVETDRDDVQLVKAFNIQYPTKDAAGADIIRRQRIALVDPDKLADEGPPIGDLDDSWTITTYHTPATSGNMAEWWMQDGPEIVWPYRFPPIVTNQNLPNPNEFWGTPDLTADVIAMQQSINFVQSNINKIIWYYGHPILWTDSDPRQVKVTPGRIVCVAPGTKLNGIDLHGDIANALNFVANLRSDMDELSRVPAVALGRMVDLPRGQLSGVALQLLFQPLIEKTQMKRRLYGRMIRDAAQRCLALGHFGDGEDLPVEIVWPDLLPVDDLQTLQALLIKQQLGWSTQSIMEEANSDYLEEMERKDAEDARNADKFNAGTGQAPQAIAAANQPLPPDTQQSADTQPPQGEKG